MNNRSVIALALCSHVFAPTHESALAIESPQRGFISERPASVWEEALLCGNGAVGALVFARPLEETITFSHERLFMPWFPSGPVVDLAPHLPEIRRLIADDRYGDAARLACDVAARQGYEDMWWTDPLVPGFDLSLTMPRAGEPTEYARSVDFETGVATTQWRDERGLVTRRVFVSRADGVAVVSLESDQPGRIECDVALRTTPDTADPGESEESYRRGVHAIEITTDGPMITYSSRFTRARPDSIAGHEGLVRAAADGGTIEAAAESLQVRGADRLVLLVALGVVDSTGESIVPSLKQRVGRIEPDFERLLERHATLHGELFGRVRLDLGGGEQRRATSEKLLNDARRGVVHAALLEKQFDAARYAILSSSGELPPTLQGIWTATWVPPWQSDFTLNGNVPSAIASVMPAAMPECMESYLGYIESHVPAFRENAKRLYGVRGIMVPSRASAHGYNTHFNEQYIHLFWTPGAAWASHFFFDYYLYTGDKEFLRTRALPFMKEAALFFEDFLNEDADGRYVFSPSYSPENTPANSDSQACVNATMDIALTKELLRNLIAACEELGTDADDVARWRAMLEKMPEYRVNEYGTVQEWTTPRLKDNHEHRHISHLYALYAGLPDEVRSSDTLPAAFKRVIEDRMAPRRRQGGGDMSFGLVQLGQSASSLGEAQLADEALMMLSRYYWRSNLASTHNPGDIFNVDICGGMPSVLIGMLLQSQPGEIRLLTAAPRAWGAGSINGLRCRGQAIVERLSWTPTRVTATIVSPRDQTVSVSLGPPPLGSGASPSGVPVSLPAGEAVTVSFKRAY